MHSLMSYEKLYRNTSLAKLASPRIENGMQLKVNMRQYAKVGISSVQ